MQTRFIKTDPAGKIQALQRKLFTAAGCPTRERIVRNEYYRWIRDRLRCTPLEARRMAEAAPLYQRWHGDAQARNFGSWFPLPMTPNDAASSSRSGYKIRRMPDQNGAKPEQSQTAA